MSASHICLEDDCCNVTHELFSVIKSDGFLFQPLLLVRGFRKYLVSSQD